MDGRSRRWFWSPLIKKEVSIIKNKQKDFEKELLNQIDDALNVNLNQAEKEALLKAKKALEKSDYLPRIISDLNAALTPMAINRSLSKELSMFYKFINDSKVSNKSLGRGLISSWGPLF